MKKLLPSVLVFTLLFLLTGNSGKAEEFKPAMLHIYIANNTLKISDPVEIRFNDQLIFSEPLAGNQAIRYKLYSKGNLHINARIDGYENTRTEYNMNILDDSLYVLVLNFESADVPGCMYALAKQSYNQYEIFYEEDLTPLVKENRALLDSGDTLRKNYAINHLLFTNNTLSFAPIRVWIDDRTMMNVNVLSLHSAYCKFYSPGKIKLTAQLGNLTETKTSEIIDLKNGDDNFVRIKFDKKNKPGQILNLDNSAGENLYISHRLDWKLDELTDLNSMYLEENREDPILDMSYEDYALAVELSSAGPSGVNFQKSYLTRNYNKARCKDLIVLSKGDSLECKIKDVDDQNVYVTTTGNQGSIETYIPRKDITSIETGICKDKMVNFWISPGASFYWNALILSAFGAGLPGGFCLSSNLYIHDLGVELGYMTLLNVNHEDLGDFKISMIPLLASWRMYENTNISFGIGFPVMKGDVTDPELWEETENLNKAWILGMTRGFKLYSGGDFGVYLASRSYVFWDGELNAASTLELLLTF